MRKTRKLLLSGLTTICMAFALASPAIAEPVPAESEGGLAPSASTNLEASPLKGEAVAKVEDTVYTTLDEAVEKAPEGSTIELLKDCELTKGFNKTLTFTGTGHITINKQLTSNGEGWMCFGLGDPSRVLTFEGPGVSVDWNSDASSSWLMLSLSGTINVEDGARLTFNFNSKDSGTRNAIYMNDGAKINVSGGSTFEIKGADTSTAERPGQGIQLDKTGKSSINVTGNSTFLIDGTNRGYVNSPNIHVEDSRFTVQNCTSNASNGGNLTAINSTVTYQNNKGHGISAGDLIIVNSNVTSSDNGLYGVYVAGKFKVDGTSTLTVSGNSYDGDCAGVNLTAGVADGHVESGAQVTITDNKCSGFSSRGVCVFEEGSKLTITGNKNDKGSASYGGGIYNTKDTAHLTLPSDAIICNNHAATGGDDIYNTGEITFGKVAANQKLDGSGIDDADDCTHAITGWYDDSKDSRWEAHASTYAGNHLKEHKMTDEATTVQGALSLKAAHGLGSATITPSNIVVYMGGNDGYDGASNSGGEAKDSVSLPNPGFYFVLPEEVNDALTDAGIIKQGVAADLSKYMKIYAVDNDGEATSSWKLDHYGQNTSSLPDGRFIYRIEPANEQTNPLRLKFIDQEGTVHLDDAFDPMDSSSLSQVFTMHIYTEESNRGSIVLEINVPGINGTNPQQFYCSLRELDETGSSKGGTLEIRYVSGKQEDVVSSVVTSEEELADAKKANPDKAFALMPDDASYIVNESGIDVTEESQNSDPSLLFDDIVSNHTVDGAPAYDEQLAKRAFDTVEENGTALENPNFQAKYLDLVDANNGNTWLTTNSDTTVFWPYPKGTDQNTEFRLVHFDGLDRDLTGGEISGAIDQATATEIAVQNTEYGIRFTTNSFSPFVLTWDSPTDGSGTENGNKPSTPGNLAQTGDSGIVVAGVFAAMGAIAITASYASKKRSEQ